MFKSTGSFFPFREELQGIFHKFFLKYPKGGNNIIYISNLVYQLLYFKRGDKQLALNLYRDMNRISSAYYKFDITPEQKEYLEIISLGRNSMNLFNLSKEIREKIKNWEIDDFIFQTAESIFKFVQEEIKTQSKDIRNFLESFVNDYNLFMIYFDYIYRFSQISDFE